MAAGHHKHGTTYDVVQGYIIQAPASAVPLRRLAGLGAASPVREPASPQSQGQTVGIPQAPAPPQSPDTPAPAMVLQAAPVSDIPMVQLGPLRLRRALSTPGHRGPRADEHGLAATTTQVHYDRKRPRRRRSRWPPTPGCGPERVGADPRASAHPAPAPLSFLREMTTCRRARCDAFSTAPPTPAFPVTTGNVRSIRRPGSRRRSARQWGAPPAPEWARAGRRRVATNRSSLWK